MQGRIELIIGPMYCGKTTEMHRRITDASFADKPSVIVKFSGDVRYASDAAIVTHSGLIQRSTERSEYAAPIRVLIADRLSSLDIPEDVVGVDEGQFYPDLAAQCEAWAQQGKRVIIAALDGDFNRQPFGDVCRIIPMCERVDKQHGVCMVCKSSESSFTKKIAAGDTVIDIGGREKYKAVCRQCY